MKIQINTDHNISGSQELNRYIDSSLSEHFERYNKALTRIEVHLSDENAGKYGINDKRCLLEARIANHQPIVVSHHAGTIHEAIEVASTKLLRSLDGMSERMTNHHSARKLLVDDIAEMESEN